MSCTDCDNPKTVAATLTQSAKFLYTAHSSVAQLYANLAERAANDTDKLLFTKAADSHNGMAQLSLQIVVPEEKEG